MKAECQPPCLKCCATTLRTIGPVHSTADYCAPVGRSSGNTYLTDPAVNGALRIVIGCLHHTPADSLPILADIQPVELGRNGATLSLERRNTGPGYLPHSVLTCNRVGIHGISNRETHLYPPHNNSAVHLASIEVRRCGRITDVIRRC